MAGEPLMVQTRLSEFCIARELMFAICDL